MHSLSIAFGPAGTVWRLLFKTAESAAAVRETVENNAADKNNDPVTVQDDFGQELTVRFFQVHGMMLEDLDESKLGNIAFALHGAHTQTDLQSAARADPKLRTAAMTQGAPMIQPMPGNGRFNS